MPHRALAAALLLTVFGAAISNVTRSEISCAKDGLYADYGRECREYVRCRRGAVSGRYSCGAGRAFSVAAGACIPRRLQSCVRRSCAPGDTSAYAAPGTACRHYYRCENDTALELACPIGAWFDFERQGCTRGAGACYEPLCAGLVDGFHPDVSHDCRRRLECRGGNLRAVAACPAGADRCPEKGERCPAPRSGAIALPAGDDDFCSDEACSTLCRLTEDGAHPDRSTGCREYFVCSSRRVTRRGICDVGMLFSGEGCEPAALVACPASARGRCFGRADGAYRDWHDCRSWYACRRERVVARGSCDDGLVWDGAECVTTSIFQCEGPAPSPACDSRPGGFYQDLASNCSRYYHCDNLRRTNFSCAERTVFNGVDCVPEAAYLCPSLDRDSCYGKTDGRYRARGSGCRGYYACAAGDKSVYACPKGLVFDGESCVDESSYGCPGDGDGEGEGEDYSCAGLADGYHRDVSSECRKYFSCEAGDRIATLTCFGSKVFDGQTCVDPEEYSCGSERAVGFGDETGRACATDGFFIQAGTSCRSYYFCIGGARSALRCPEGRLFDGQVCVPADSYTCPGG